MTDHTEAAALWPAPLAAGPVDATVTVPGSKSVTNRGLVLAALASEPGWLRRPLRSRDTLLMAEALRTLGADIEETVSSSSSPSPSSGTPGGTGESWRIIPDGLYGPATGYIAVVFLAASQPWLVSSHIIRPDIVVATLVMAGLYSALRGIQDGSRPWHLLAGLCLGLSFDVHPNSLAFMPLVADSAVGRVRVNVAS